MNYAKDFLLLMGFTLVIFLVFLVLGIDNTSHREHFIDPEKLVLYQGNTLPLDGNISVGYSPMYPATLPTVDGTNEAKRSMFSFSFNECKPECCKTSPYSCDRGCICIDQKQYEFIGSRGGNNQQNSCNKKDPEKTSSVGFFDPSPKNKTNIWS